MGFYEEFYGTHRVTGIMPVLETEPTPEGLRKAAEILLEKAKVLDKGKLSTAQLAALAYADEHSLDIINEMAGTRNYFRIDEYCTSQKGKAVHQSSYSETAKNRYVPLINVMDVKLRTFVDECDDVEVAVVWRAVGIQSVAKSSAPPRRQPHYQTAAGSR